MKNRNLRHCNDWKTPAWLYKLLDDEFNFDFDPCPYSEDKPKFNGLEATWGERNFVNPPYSLRLKTEFVAKALSETVWPSKKSVSYFFQSQQVPSFSTKSYCLTPQKCD